MSKLDYPRNMEPPEGVCLKIDLKHSKALEIFASVFTCKRLEVVGINIIRARGENEVLRLRGGVGGTDPNTDEKFNDIYLSPVCVLFRVGPRSVCVRVWCLSRRSSPRSPFLTLYVEKTKSLAVPVLVSGGRVPVGIREGNC